jgi:polyferredoxin
MVSTWLLVEFFGVLALCAVASASLLAVCDPYAHYGRIATNLVRPAVQWLANCGAAWSDAHEKYWLMSVEVAAPVAFALVVSVATLVMVAAFALWRGRWFCNHVCPVGACLRLTSRKAPLLKIRIDAAKCVGCGICERGCKAGAIDAKAKTVDNGLCVRCFDCLGACGKGAVGL